MLRKLLLILGICGAHMHADDNLTVLIERDEIAQKIAIYAAEINRDYDEITVVMVMKGAFVFVADLIRQIDIPVQVEYVRCKSYRGDQPGELVITGVDALDIEGKHILLVDDIIDSGYTMHGLSERLEEKNPASVRTLALLSKPARRAVEFEPDDILFQIDNLFVVGYGLDYDENYRGLPDICYFKE